MKNPILHKTNFTKKYRITDVMDVDFLTLILEKAKIKGDFIFISKVISQNFLKRDRNLTTLFNVLCLSNKKFKKPSKNFRDCNCNERLAPAEGHSGGLVGDKGRRAGRVRGVGAVGGRKRQFDE